MRFDEPDVRAAYQRGVRDLYESVSGALKPRQAHAIEDWMDSLATWQEGEPPHSPLV